MNEKNKPIAILATFSVFFIFLIDKFWFSPDEYLYVALGRSFASAYDTGCLYYIDSVHTPLSPFLISLGYYFSNIDSILFYRLISLIFSIATIYVFYKIVQIAFEKKRDAIWLFAILLFFPGFFTFAIKVNVDILALFFSAIIIYLLLKRAAYWKIGIILVLIFLSKEYVSLFSVFIIFFVILVDALKRAEASFMGRIKEVVYNFSFAFLPLLGTVIFFIAFPILPYPRMLDNVLLELFSFRYDYLGQTIKHLLGTTPGIETSVETAYETFKNINPITQTDMASVAGELSFWGKISSIYKSNYGEIDVNILAIPLVVIGLMLRAKYLYLFFRNKYDSVRKDLIMILLFFIVSYFNYHIASQDHGFRIIIPLLISYIYFIYWTLKALFAKRNYWIKFSFMILSFIFIFIYFQVNAHPFSYNSVISKNNLVAIFLKHKVIINVVVYTLVALFMLFYSSLSFKKKHLLFAVILMLLFAYKVFPFTIDKYFSNKEYGNDYDLILARPYLEDIEKNDSIVLTNSSSYKYYYYANITKMPNVDRADLPIIRKKPEIIYQSRLISTDYLQKNMRINFICQNAVDYVFYVHSDNSKDVLNDYINNLPYISPVREYYLPGNNRFNWGIYKVDKNFCNQ